MVCGVWCVVCGGLPPTWWMNLSLMSPFWLKSEEFFRNEDFLLLPLFAVCDARRHGRRRRAQPCEVKVLEEFPPACRPDAARRRCSSRSHRHAGRLLRGESAQEAPTGVQAGCCEEKKVITFPPACRPDACLQGSVFACWQPYMRCGQRSSPHQHQEVQRQDPQTRADGGEKRRRREAKAAEQVSGTL